MDHPTFSPHQEPASWTGHDQIDESGFQEAGHPSHRFELPAVA